MAKRSSGAWRRAYASAIKNGAFFGLLRPGKAGRPKGSRTTKDRIEGFGREGEGLHAFLIWIGRPDLSVAEIIELLHTRDTGLDSEGEYNRKQIVRAYGEMGGRRTLQRDIAILLRKIWGDVKPSQRKAWGRSVRAGGSLGWRKEPKKTVTKWEKAGVSKATWYRRQHRRRAP
jgi:hypothetical protein